MAHIFDPDELSFLARAGIGESVEQNVQAVVAAMSTRYGADVIYPEREWFFSNAGGIMGTVTLLHASLTEYVLIFGTPIASEGHSGRHRSDIWDTVISGTIETYQEHELEKKVHRPGDVAYLPRGTSNCSRCTDGTFMVEYARGNVPSMLPFALGDAFFSTLDRRGIVDTFKVYNRCVLREYKRRLLGGGRA